MAENTLIQFPGVTTVEPPRPSLSKRDIEEPFNNLAAGLDRLGEGVSEAAVPLAEKEGRDAVQTDDQGNLVIAPNPMIVGPAGAAYSRSVQMTALAKIQPQIEKDLLDLRMQNRYDPNGFKTASDAYIKNLGGQFKSTPALQGAIEHSAQENFVHNYRTVLTETDAHQTAEALQAYQSRLSDINDNTAALARQGGADTPEYQKAAAARAQLWDELVNDPRFKFSRERADLEINQAYSKDQAQAIIGDTVRTFQTRANKGEAQKFLTEKFWDPALKLSPSEREHGINEGLHALEIVDSVDRERLSDNRRMVSTYTDNLKRDPATFDPGMHNNMVQKSLDLGDHKSVADLEAAQSFLPMWQDIKAMPNGQAAQTLRDLSAGVVPHGRFDDIVDREAKRSGLDPDTVRRIINIESSGRPNAQAGSYKGLMQLSDAEFNRFGGSGNIFDPEQNIIAGVNSLADKSANFAASHGGRTPTATELYLMHQQGEAGAAAHLANPDRPAWQNMANTAEGRQKGEGWAKAAIWGNIPASARSQFPGGVDSVTSRDFVNIWQQRVEGAPIGGSHVDIFTDSPTGRLWESTVKDYRARVGAVAEHMAAGLEKQIDAGDTVRPADYRDFVETAVQSGKDELIEKLQPKVDAYNRVQAAQAGGPLSADAAKAQIEAAKGAGVSPTEYLALSTAEDIIAKSAQRMQAEPLVEGSRKGWFDPVNPIDPTNPGQMTNEIIDRQRKAQILQAHDQNHGAVNVLGANEAMQVANTLTRGDPQVAATVIDGLMGSATRPGLQPPEFRATMSSPTIRDAVKDMAGSGDPVRMGAAMQAMSALQLRDPVAFHQAYGEEASRELHGWMALRGRFSDAEIAQKIKEASDPRMKDAMDKVAEAAKKEIRTDPQWVANQMGSWADRWIPFVNASVPYNSTQAQIMADDFTNTYVAMRQYGADPDSAKQEALKRLAEVWSPSQVNGGRFMQSAPEAATLNGKRYYPPIDGSYQYLVDQRDAFIIARYGRELVGREGPVGGPFGAPGGLQWEPKATFAGLVADPQTEAERKSGTPPSYLMSVYHGGRLETVTGPDGMPARIRWNVPVAIKAAAAGMQPAVDWRQSPSLDQIVQGSSSADVGAFAVGR